MDQLDRELFEGSPDCTKLIDGHGRLLAMNGNGRCLMEIDDFGAIEGQIWSSLWPEETRPQIEAAVTRACAGEATRLQAFCPTAKGQPRWWDVTVCRVREGDSDATRLLSVSRDVTELHLAREEQRRIATRLQLALDASGIGEWELDVETGAGHLSAGGARCFGLPNAARDWAVADLLSHVHPADRVAVQTAVESAMQCLGPIALDFRILSVDADERWLRMRGICDRAIEEGGAQLLATFLDISEARWAEEELREMGQSALQSAREAERERNRMTALLEAAPVGIGYANRTGQIEVVNAANRQLWGNHPLSDSVNEYVEWKGWWADGSDRHGRPLRSEEWGLARALQGEHVAGDLVEIEPFDSPGTRKTILLRATPVNGPNGEIEGAVVAQIDITDRVRAQAALRESEAKFRTIANAMPQMVWSTLPDGYHDFYNDRWYEFTGVPPGSTDGEGWNGMFHPEDQPRAWEQWRRSLETGEPYEIEYRLRNHAGRYRWVLGRALPVLDENDTIVRWMGTCTDIHEQKTIQDALVESESRFRALVGNIPQLAWMMQPDGWIFWYNDRWFEYTGTTLAQMQGSGWQDVHHPDHLDRVAEKFSRHIETGEPWEDTFPLRGADGNYRWFLSRAVPIRDDAGEIVRWFGSNTDVTLQREAEHSLREAARRKDEFLAMLAHELRNPLAPIRTAAHLMAHSSNSPATAQRAAAIVERQVAHMTELVDDLLDVSRVTRGVIELERTDFDLREALRAAVEQIRPTLESRGHSMSVRLGAGPLWVNGDRTRLTQVAANLLANAAKFTPENGKVVLEAGHSSGGLWFRVTDDGIGIGPDLLPHVFELFTQGQRSLDRVQGGLGIGLALVKGIVELHGGQVQAVSPGDGQGSCFEVVLPEVAAPALPHVDLSTTAHQMAAVRRRVVVVDDNDDAADTLSLLLQTRGHEVLTYGSSEALLADSPNADVFLLDVGLPGISGIELAMCLRARHGQTIRLIALTGYGQDSDRRATSAAGFDLHLVKPVDPDQLFEAIEAVALPT